MSGQPSREHQRERKRESAAAERFYVASQWQLIFRKFRKHRLAAVGSVILGILYVVAGFAEFISPYDILERSSLRYSPPHRVRLIDDDGRLHLRPFVYGLARQRDPETWELTYTEDRSQRYPIRFFTRGAPYKMWSFLPLERRLFGVAEPGKIFLFGTDRLGRDLFSRVIYAARVSLSIGLVGVAFSFVLGCILGGISGYFGSKADVIIQRVIEIFMSLPQIPLWIALAAALPQDWSVIKTYFAITVILSLIGWTTLARVVRGKLISLREEDFVLAARISGMRSGSIILRHLLPSFMSYLVVNVTLAVPAMILGETALSFLGLGIRPPAVSWGALLKSAQQVNVVALYPWLLIPGLLVIVTVLAFNFLGDGLRDAADPYR